MCDGGGGLWGGPLGSASSRLELETPGGGSIQSLPVADFFESSKTTNWSSHETNKVASYTKPTAIAPYYNHHEGARPCSPVIGRVLDKTRILADRLEEVVSHFFVFVARDIVDVPFFISDVSTFERRKW